jgi:ribosome-binding factor A
MATPRRVLRLQQLILETAALTIQRDLHDPRIGMVSVTRVKLSPDLTSAIVYWSTIDADADRRTTERGLEDALPVVQRAVGRALTTRVTPTISLRFDPTLERAARLEDIFERLKQERGGGEGSDSAAQEEDGDEDAEEE